MQIGDDPGNGALLGQVTDAMGKPIDGAVVSVDRGLWMPDHQLDRQLQLRHPQRRHLRAAHDQDRRTPATQMITVNKGASTTANVSLP